MNKQRDIVITYGWCRTAYMALRSLTGMGLKVAVADTGRLGMSQCSRLRSGAYRYRSPYRDPDAFVLDINEILQRTGAHFLLPAHDETEVLARYRDRIPSSVLLPVAEYEKIATANDKYAMHSLAAGIGAPVPPIVEWNEYDDILKKIGSKHGRFVIKMRRGNSAKGVYYAGSATETVALCRKLEEQYAVTPERRPIIQEYVDGEGWGVSCLYHRGRKLASFTHRRLREKTSTGGTSTLRESKRNQLIEGYAEKILTDMRWHGLAMVEFKYNPATGQAWFIEVNPRLWGSIGLATASGVDFIRLLYVAETEGPDVAQKLFSGQREGVVCRWWLGDLIRAVGDVSRFRIQDAFDALRPRWSAVSDDLWCDDPFATAGEFLYYASKFLRAGKLNPEDPGMVG